MQEIQLQAIPAQSLKVILGGQNCDLSIYQKPQGLFVDIAVDGADIMRAVIALDLVPLVSREYSSFIGNLLFVDTQGAADPSHTGLGARFTLVYLTAAEYALF